MYMRVFLFSFYLFTIALLYCLNADFYSNSIIKSWYNFSYPLAKAISDRDIKYESITQITT